MHSMRMAFAHVDQPAFKIKGKSAFKNLGCAQLNVGVYGGMMDHTWFDRPLGMSGMIVRKGEDAFHPIVSAGGTLRPDSYHADVQADVIVADYQVFGGELVVVHERTDAFATEVHERHGLHEDDLFSGDNAASGKSAQAAVRDADVPSVGEFIDHSEAYVVPCSAIF